VLSSYYEILTGETMTVTTTPTLTREAILERVTSALVEGRDLNDLTAAQALGIPQVQIDAANQNTELRIPRLGRDFTRHRTSTLRQKIVSKSPLTVVGLGGRELICEQMTPLVQELGVEALFEMCEHPAHIEMLRRITPGLLTVQFSTKFSDTAVRFGGQSYAIARQPVVDLLEASPAWEVFNCPWDERYPAFAVKVGDDTEHGKVGAGHTIVVLINLFGTDSGQWVRSANGLEPRIEAFTQIMRCAMPLMTAAFRYPRGDEADNRQQIREATAIFNSIKAFGAQALGNLNRDLESAQRDYRHAMDRIEHHRQRLLNYSTSAHENAERMRLLSADQGSRIATALESVTNNLERIRNLRAVRNVEFTTYRQSSALYVEFYDVVVKDERGPNRVCKNIAFWIILDPGVTYPIVFDASKKPDGQHGVHPNVGDRGDVCWGQLEVPITEQIRNRDWNGVVSLTVRMLQNVGYPELVAPNAFPTAPANALPGFQYPGRTNG
jgi:hypothetical protein